MEELAREAERSLKEIMRLTDLVNRGSELLSRPEIHSHDWRRRQERWLSEAKHKPGPVPAWNREHERRQPDKPIFDREGKR
jgi:hypothetical protein